MSGLVEYAPGMFARRGEKRTVDGITWIFTGHGHGWTTDARPYGRQPPELRSRDTAGDTARRPRSLPSWTLGDR